jgi:crotonobetainyl-CoA:carnitine CoA-transferase CaiB-like acyl-CoA transferase
MRRDHDPETALRHRDATGMGLRIDMALRGTPVAMLAEVMRRAGKGHWLSALETAEVLCGAINNLTDLFGDPQVKARETRCSRSPLAGRLAAPGARSDETVENAFAGAPGGAAAGSTHR